MEEWKDVVGWGEKYKVSNEGKVWNKITNVEVAQVLTGIPQYKYVNLNFNKKYKLVRLHVIIAEAFIENPDKKKFVDHINQDKMDNSISNLQWVSRSENGRNMGNNFVVNINGVETLLIKYLYDMYGEDPKMYRYVYGRMKTHKEDVHTAVSCWTNRRIIKRRTKKEILEGVII